MNIFGQAVPTTVIKKIFDMSEERTLGGMDVWGLVPVLWKAPRVENSDEFQALMAIMMREMVENAGTLPNFGAILVKHQNVVLINPDAVRMMIKKIGRVDDWNGFKKALISLGYKVIERNKFIEG